VLLKKNKRRRSAAPVVQLTFANDALINALAAALRARSALSLVRTVALTIVKFVRKVVKAARRNFVRLARKLAKAAQPTLARIASLFVQFAKFLVVKLVPLRQSCQNGTATTLVQHSVYVVVRFTQMMNRPAMFVYRVLKKRPYAMSQVLKFSPLAWHKLQYMCHLGDTEVGGFGISKPVKLTHGTVVPENYFYIEDFKLVKQRSTYAFVKFTDEGIDEHMTYCVDNEIDLQRGMRIWIHTHPGQSAQPSFTDENTFKDQDSLGQCDWAVMFILSRTNETYARLRFSAGPGGQIMLPVEIDWSTVKESIRTFANNIDAYDAEYARCVEKSSYSTGYAPYGGGVSSDKNFPRHAWERNHASESGVGTSTVHGKFDDHGLAYENRLVRHPSSLNRLPQQSQEPVIATPAPNTIRLYLIYNQMTKQYGFYKKEEIKNAAILVRSQGMKLLNRGSWDFPDNIEERLAKEGKKLPKFNFEEEAEAITWASTNGEKVDPHQHAKTCPCEKCWESFKPGNSVRKQQLHLVMLKLARRYEFRDATQMIELDNSDLSYDDFGTWEFDEIIKTFPTWDIQDGSGAYFRATDWANKHGRKVLTTQTVKAIESSKGWLEADRYYLTWIPTVSQFQFLSYDQLCETWHHVVEDETSWPIVKSNWYIKPDSLPNIQSWQAAEEEVAHSWGRAHGELIGNTGNYDPFRGGYEAAKTAKETLTVNTDMRRLFLTYDPIFKDYCFINETILNTRWQTCCTKSLHPPAVHSSWDIPVSINETALKWTKDELDEAIAWGRRFGTEITEVGNYDPCKFRHTNSSSATITKLFLTYRGAFDDYAFLTDGQLKDYWVRWQHMPNQHPKVNSVWEIRGNSSVTHVYGKSQLVDARIWANTHGKSFFMDPLDPFEATYKKPVTVATIPDLPTIRFLTYSPILQDHELITNSMLEARWRNNEKKPHHYPVVDSVWDMAAPEHPNVNWRRWAKDKIEDARTFCKENGKQVITACVDPYREFYELPTKPKASYPTLVNPISYYLTWLPVRVEFKFLLANDLMAASGTKGVYAPTVISVWLFSESRKLSLSVTTFSKAETAEDWANENGVCIKAISTEEALIEAKTALSSGAQVSTEVVLVKPEITAAIDEALSAPITPATSTTAGPSSVDLGGDIQLFYLAWVPAQQTFKFLSPQEIIDICTDSGQNDPHIRSSWIFSTVYYGTLLDYSVDEYELAENYGKEHGEFYEFCTLKEALPESIMIVESIDKEAAEALILAGLDDTFAEEYLKTLDKAEAEEKPKVVGLLPYVPEKEPENANNGSINDVGIKGEVAAGHGLDTGCGFGGGYGSPNSQWGPGYEYD
jgi:hypothetical protein